MRRPVYFYTYVGGDTAASREVLCSDPAMWLPDAAGMNGDGWAVTLRAEGLLAAAGVRALVEVGDPITPDTKDIVIRPIGWRAVSADTLFPILEADLELEALTADRSQLRMMGSYRPPLSVLGDAADHLIGRRVAEGVVREFVLGVAGGLERAAKLSA